MIRLFSCWIHIVSVDNYYYYYLFSFFSSFSFIFCWFYNKQKGDKIMTFYLIWKTNTKRTSNKKYLLLLFIFFDLIKLNKKIIKKKEIKLGKIFKISLLKQFSSKALFRIDWNYMMRRNILTNHYFHLKQFFFINIFFVDCFFQINWFPKFYMQYWTSTIFFSLSFEALFHF